MMPAATGTDTAGSLRIPSALCGTSTIKPTRGLVSLRGIVPLAPIARPRRADGAHASPTASRCSRRWPRRRAPGERRPLRRIARLAALGLGELDPDVADGFEQALAALPAGAGRPPPPTSPLDVGRDFIDVVLRRDARLPPPLRRPARAATARRCADSGRERRERATRSRRGVRRRPGAARRGDRRSGSTGSPSTGSTRCVEPTVPIVAPAARARLRRAFTDVAEISLTHYWNWTGFPVVALPSGVGSRSGLPVGVSLIGPPRVRLGSARLGQRAAG